MRRVLATTLLGAALAGAAAAQVADGVYDMGACTPGALSDGRVTIEGVIVEFSDARCELTNETTVRDMAGAVLYDAVCDGEAGSATRRLMLMPGPEGRLIIAQAGFATTYSRCE